MNKLNCMMMAGTLLVTACQPTGKTGDVIGKQPVRVRWNHDHRSAHGIRQSKRSRSFS